MRIQEICFDTVYQQPLLSRHLWDIWAAAALLPLCLHCVVLGSACLDGHLIVLRSVSKPFQNSAPKHWQHWQCLHGGPMQRGELGNMPCNASGNIPCRRSACLHDVRNAADRKPKNF